jgi:hypothetical protein
LLQTLRTTVERAEPPARGRGELLCQLERLRELYLMGDLTKAQYVMRRQALEEQLERLAPPSDPGIERARELLEDFARFWELETEPAERRKLLLSLFGQVWARHGRIVAVQPHEPFLPYFHALDTAQSRWGKFGAEGGSDGTRTRDLCRDRAAL